MNLQDKLKQALEAIDAMTPEQFEQELIKFGYYPIRKRPTNTQKELEKQFTYTNLDTLFNRVSEGELKEELRSSILHMRRVAELMDMLKIDLPQ